MIYCARYYQDFGWRVVRSVDFIETLLFVTRNSNHFQIWHQNKKKMTDRVLVAYQGEIE